MKILNDTSRTVQVWQCDTSCRRGFHDRVTLAAGQHTLTNVSTVGVPNTWLVLDTRSRRIGCLPIVMPEAVTGLVARVSHREKRAEEATTNIDSGLPVDVARSRGGMTRPVPSIDQRVAVLLVETATHYWTLIDQLEIDRVEAMRRAREILDLSGEISERCVDDGHAGAGLLRAASALVVFGDGYALHSVECPQAIRPGSVPDRVVMELHLRRIGVLEWARATIRGEGVVRDRRTGGVAVCGAASASPVGERRVLRSDFERFRESENRDWDGWEEASQAAAIALLAWLANYERMLRVLEAGTDQEYVDGLFALRGQVVESLDWARSAMNYWQVHGGQAEAIFAAAATASLMRSIFLVATTREVRSISGLHLWQSKDLDMFLADYSLRQWAAETSGGP